MGCGAIMEQVVPCGYMNADAKLVPIKCGNTTIHGTEARCQPCSKKRPWYICVHGNDVSERDCFECNMEGHWE